MAELFTGIWRIGAVFWFLAGELARSFGGNLARCPPIAAARNWRRVSRPRRWRKRLYWRGRADGFFSSIRLVDCSWNFLIRQIAADEKGFGADPDEFADLGFLTLGRCFLDDQNLIIDDCIAGTIHGTMALTVGCARCPRPQIARGAGGGSRRGSRPVRGLIPAERLKWLQAEPFRR